MITLGSILSKMLNGKNPSVYIMPTRDLKKGNAAEITGLHMAELDGKEVLVLTI